MQTQCPHCETRFRVTETQVNAADGFVRCSVCEEVFNAFEVVEHDEHQPSLLNQEPLNETPSIEPIASAEAIEDTETTAQQPGSDISDFEPAKNNTYQNNVNETLNDSEKTKTTDNSRKDAFDFFDEEDNESLSHVVPEKFKQSHATDSNSFLSNLLWGIGTLLLIATLAIEYAWFNRDQLNQIPQLQAWTEKLCRHIECKDVTMRNPKKIELISRNVYSHPNEKNALMVNITMKNLADFAQPYPIMQITFSDVRGSSVAARRFLPNEYLPAEIQQQVSQQAQLFEADTNMTFTMEIQDPGKQAMTYEFDFL